MNKKPCMWRVRPLVVLLLILLAAGCSYTAVPRSVPLLPQTESGSLAGAWVLVTNAEKDNSVSPIMTDNRENSYFKANRKMWSEKLVESLAGELARRGASVHPGAPVTLSVALPQITFIETRDFYQFNVKAVVVSSSGWSKEYSGTAEISAASVLSIQEESDRLAGRALSSLTKEMLGDEAFLQQVKTGKR